MIQPLLLVLLLPIATGLIIWSLFPLALDLIAALRYKLAWLRYARELRRAEAALVDQVVRENEQP